MIVVEYKGFLDVLSSIGTKIETGLSTIGSALSAGISTIGKGIESAFGGNTKPPQGISKVGYVLGESVGSVLKAGVTLATAKATMDLYKKLGVFPKPKITVSSSVSNHQLAYLTMPSQTNNFKPQPQYQPQAPQQQLPQPPPQQRPAQPTIHQAPENSLFNNKTLLMFGGLLIVALIITSRR